MINHKFNSETNILEVVYSGKITFEELDNFGEYVMNTLKLPRNLNILTDARNAIYDIKRINFRTMFEQMEKHLKPYIFVKNALLHNKPKETAVSMITESKININNYKQKIFYTEDAAISWLKDN